MIIKNKCLGVIFCLHLTKNIFDTENFHTCTQCIYIYIYIYIYKFLLEYVSSLVDKIFNTNFSSNGG